MKVKKIFDVDITGVTLLSIDEYEKYKDNIPLLNDIWWLKSPGYKNHLAAYVDDIGICHCDGLNTSIKDVATRPVLQISNLAIGDKFELDNKIFTVISSEYAICDTFIGHGVFRKNWKAENANIYEASDIKIVMNFWLGLNLKGITL